MRYVGGKGRIAKSIAKTILDRTQARETYIEPFVGGAAVFGELAPAFKNAFAGDLSPDLIMLWNALVGGWQPPESVTEAEYALLRASEPSALRGLVGFGGSFGGKWWGGYARGGFNGTTPRNHYGESARSAVKFANSLVGHNVQFRHADYKSWSPRPESVVYCDPPYASTLGYAVGAFNTPEFWSVMEDWAQAGTTVFVSEYEAPPGWKIVWEGKIRQSVTMPSQGRVLTTERLFQADHHESRSNVCGSLNYSHGGRIEIAPPPS